MDTGQVGVEGETGTNEGSLRWLQSPESCSDIQLMLVGLSPGTMALLGGVPEEQEAGGGGRKGLSWGAWKQ